MAHHWYALHVKPHKEPSVIQLLEYREIEAYYPVLKVNPVNPRSRKERPFFPGYMFVRVDLNETGADTLRWTEGTHGLVQFGGEPSSVPDSLITELEEQLAKFAANVALDKPEFSKGDQVHIVKGLFEGYDAIFDTQLSGNDRVQVLLAYMNQQPKKLVLDPSEIEKAKRRRY
jgi:transcription elongation factor/antiterminator RfaH